MEVGRLKFTWKIKNFSNIQTDEELHSNVFSLGPYKWRISASPRVEDYELYLSLCLEVADSETLPSGWSRKAKFSFTLIDQINNYSVTESEDEHEFDAETDFWGFFEFISYDELNNPDNGFLVKDTCIIEADVTMYGDVSAESHGTNNVANEEEFTENLTEEDMDAFFVDMQSVISTNEVPSPDEEAKEALEFIEEALDMVPSALNNPGRIAQLKNAFDILSSLDDCSILTLEQKEELLSMKDNFIGLPQRAANAVKDLELFTEKELVRTTLDSKMKKCLIEFGKAKEDAMQNENNIVVLQERVDSLLAQIGEKKKKKESSFSKQKEMFKLFKELKAELDVLVKNWPEFEEKMKAAEKEYKVVVAEWSKMKQFVSSLKKRYVKEPSKADSVQTLQRVERGTGCAGKELARV